MHVLLYHIISPDPLAMYLHVLKVLIFGNPDHNRPLLNWEKEIHPKIHRLSYHSGLPVLFSTSSLLVINDSLDPFRHCTFEITFVTISLDGDF